MTTKEATATATATTTARQLQLQAQIPLEDDRQKAAPLGAALIY
jgi:hypothetical protein